MSDNSSSVKKTNSTINSAASIESIQKSSPQLLKHLTMTVQSQNQQQQNSNATTDKDSAGAAAVVPRKRLKLDIEAAINSKSTTASENNVDDKTVSNSSSMRRRLLEKRLARLARISDGYKDNMSELFFLQSRGNVVDLPAFRKKPSQQYLSFLKSNSAPENVLKDVRLAVFGPNALLTATTASDSGPTVKVSSTTGRVTVSSAAMAAAVVAAQGMHGWKMESANGGNSPSTSSNAKPPYSPRVGGILSPVKYGDQLLVRTPAEVAAAAATAARTDTYSIYRLPTYTKEVLVEKMRQEAWVARRVKDLDKEGLWSEKRLPKVCERPRGRTQWDSVLSEMQWLAPDFAQERRWKKAAAKMLAYSAKEYVEQMAERKAKALAAREKRHRKIAKFIAGQVLLFWSNIAQSSLQIQQQQPQPQQSSYQEKIVTFNVPNRGGHQSKSSPTTDLLGGEASSESGVCNLDDEDGDSSDSTDSYELELSDGEDDESTIAEQEVHEEATEAEHRAEVKLLEEDNSRSLEVLLKTAFPGYDPSDFQQQHDSSISSDEEDSDSYSVDSDDDEALENDMDFTEAGDLEKVVNLPMSKSQRKLYDDYLSSDTSQRAIGSGNAESIANVLDTLRKICSHPHLLQQVPELVLESESSSSSLNFPRVIDDLKIPKLAASAAEYDPYAEVDLASLNLVFLAHEGTLTALTSDRIRKCRASRNLIEELPDKTEADPPGVPRGRLALQISTSNSSSFGGIGNSFQNGAAGGSHFTTSEQSINGQHILLTSTPVNVARKQSNKEDAVKKETTEEETEIEEDEDKAFHRDSLNVIAKFNERRCNGIPLYGQDLVEVLTICDGPYRPTEKWLSSTASTLPAAASSTSRLQQNQVMESKDWPLCLQPKGKPLARRSALFKSTLAAEKLMTTATALKIHSEDLTVSLTLCPKIFLSSSWTNPALRSNKFPVSMMKQQTPPSPPTSLINRKFDPVNRVLRDVSAKLAKLDALLQDFRRRNERCLVFCEMPEMRTLLCRYLRGHHYNFIYLNPDFDERKRMDLMNQFSLRSHFGILLSSPKVVTPPCPMKSLANITRVVFFDSNLVSDSDECEVNSSLEWCRSFSPNHSLFVYKLVCEGTVEDSLSIKALQQRLLLNNRAHGEKQPENGSNAALWKIKKHTLEALFSPSIGDNGILEQKVMNFREISNTFY